ncbi:MAG TPA: hypothetical protein VGR32_07195 [Brevundimonas sp.]|jgi:hypothetical protein|uniref:hypothetical protein n=1 Tax=Brevundimonas sp. TaxID=1871086 RepID=UPI002DF55AC8|nr:hypothetical protein [Brevundimonas sp.]
MLKKLAAFLGFLCLVLLVMAFDEGQVKRGVDVVRTKIEPAVERLRERAPVLRPSAPAATTPGSRAVVGAFAARDGTPGGDVSVDGAVLVFEGAPALRTRPHRIALGRDAAVRGMALPADRQIELREIVPLDAGTPVAGSPLCGGGKPGWLAIVRDGGTLHLQVWAAGPAPDAPGAVLCGRHVYEGARR